MAGDSGRKTHHPAYSGYVLLIVGLASVANYYDRNLLTILVEPVKRDLHISDAQVGLLAGLGFAVMYSLVGIPMARLADRFGRARVLGVALAVWSVMTALSGTTVNFVTMLAARIGVGVGEAGGLPASHALIADYFSPRWRGKALSVIGVSGGVGLTLAMALGGAIVDWRGWRMAFYLAGLPGVALALLVLLTIREPKLARAAEQSTAATPLGQVFATLWGRKSYVLLCVGLGIAAIGAYGHQAWTPAFLMRTYHKSAGEIGGLYSAAVGPATVISIFLGGGVNDWLAARDKRWPLWLLALAFGLTIPSTLLVVWTRDLNLALGVSVVSTLAGGLWVGPAYALVQSLSGERLRAISAAIFMMIVNIVGLGLGPVVVGVISDALKPGFGAAALTLSLSSISVTYVIGVVCFLAATRTVVADVAAADREAATAA